MGVSIHIYVCFLIPCYG